GVRELPGAVPVDPVEGHDHPRRGDRRLPGADPVGAADRAVAFGVGGHAGQPGRVRALPLYLARALLDDAGVPGDLAVLGHRQEPARRGRPRGLPGAAGPVRDRDRRRRGLGALTPAGLRENDGAAGPSGPAVPLASGGGDHARRETLTLITSRVGDAPVRKPFFLDAG